MPFELKYTSKKDGCTYCWDDEKEQWLVVDKVFSRFIKGVRNG